MMNTMSRLRSEEQGFTLIELMIVMIVLGILAGIVLFSVGAFDDDAESAKDDANDRICATAEAAATAKYGDAYTEAQLDEFVEDDTVCTKP
jgi:prepilin-type N-terminal cleavage/methylation domain-containing protein